MLMGRANWEWEVWPTKAVSPAVHQGSSQRPLLLLPPIWKRHAMTHSLSVSRVPSAGPKRIILFNPHHNQRRQKVFSVRFPPW